MMGTDLEDVLDKLKEFKNHMDYWFTCLGDEWPLVQDKILEIELLLRAINEERKT